MAWSTIRYGLEYDPAYVDVSVRRWETYTKGEAVLDGDGRTYAEVRSERLAEARTQTGRPTTAAAVDETSAAAPKPAGQDGAVPHDAAVVPLHRRAPGGVR
jgi:hypothetical protein